MLYFQGFFFPIRHLYRYNTCRYEADTPDRQGGLNDNGLKRAHPSFQVCRAPAKTLNELKLDGSVTTHREKLRSNMGKQFGQCFM